ncbi:MAG: thioesterase family protein [Novosphingobium sp.]|nr:thioesterase family protein [Novosphingobium sp.]
MSREFFDLLPTHNSHRWYLPVAREIAAGPPDRLFLFGGVGLGAAIAAMERTLDRPVIWATAQYASFARLGSVVDFDVREVNVGNSLTQAQVVAHIHDKAILTISAALGQRSGPSDQWLRPEPAPPPMECPEVHHWRRNDSPIDGRIEKRLIAGRFPTGEPIAGRGDTGRVRLWVRSREGVPASARFLAVVADFVVEATSQSLGRYAGGNSLDNTIRFGPIVESEWLLCDLEIEAIHNGITHGTMKIYSEGGVLMATASQSLILRLHSAEGQSQPPGHDNAR